MLIGIAELLHYGVPFWVRVNLAQGDQFLVIPPDTIQVAGAGGSGEILLDYRLIVLGLAYRFTSTVGGAEGFDLVFQPNAGTSPDTGTQHIIFSANAIVTNGQAENAINCFCPGPGAVYSPLTQPASLCVNVRGTLVGFLTVWGMLVDGNLRLARKYTGSPFDFGTLGQ